ncbi:hypothetical protein AGOR_G00227280 [Albula goreensis]|uniref:Fibronectin type-III domain-containing protein n=1 Tax=Albula goreensis TaxID=1534307 RepID=A0A8T3CJ65_9TELE|nr:hypothetical protein AGOR_G00227280 [Albula goreensis]
MLLPWVLWASALLLTPASGATLCTGQNGAANSTPQYTSSLFESLRCYCDYKSYIRCSWTDSKHTNGTPSSLFHWNRLKKRMSLCALNGQPTELPDGRIYVQCQYNTTLFALGNRDSFLFNTSCAPLLSKTLTPLQHVRVGPPLKVSQIPMKGGGMVLEWLHPQLSSHSLLDSMVDYQVSYRRLGQDWTDVEVSGQKYKIEADILVPGCKYEARVRARKDKGIWSEWSPLVAWQTKAQEGLGASNLRCLFDGEKVVNCTWEVKRELARFINYSLQYRLSAASDAQMCDESSVFSTDSREPVLRFGCSFTVSNPGQQLEVHLIPTYNFQSYKSIKSAPPAPVNVTEKGQEWVLSWTPPKHPSDCCPLEVCYGRCEKEESEHCHDFAKGVSSFTIHRSYLLPSTCYRAKVRTLAIKKFDYSGFPSEWTEPVEWTSHPAPWSITTLIYIFISVLVAVMFIILYFTLPACHRRIILWHVSVPSPIKSKVLEEIMKRSPNSLPALQKEMERTRICSVQVLDKVQLPCFLEDSKHPLELTNGSGISSKSWEGDGQSDELSSPDSLSEKDTSMSFSGPYILCPTCSSQGSNAEDEASAETSHYTTSLCSASTTATSTSTCTTQLLTLSLSQSNIGYVGLPMPQVSLAENSEQRAPDGHVPAWDGYVANARALMDSIQPEVVPEFPDCDPPAYTPSLTLFQPVVLQGVPDYCFHGGPKATSSKAIPTKGKDGVAGRSERGH